jgi:hypothetical protein
VSASRAPWRLGDPAPWRLGNPSPRRPGRDWLSVHDYLAPEPITLAVETRRDVIRDRFSDTTEMLFRAAGDGGGVLAGRMMPYGEWTEVNSLKEGHFLERFAPGALAGNAIPAMAKRIRVLFEHGLDTVLGRQAIAAIEEMRDEPDGAYYRARLLDGLPELLVAGLRRGRTAPRCGLSRSSRTAFATRSGASTTPRGSQSTRLGRRASVSSR